MGFIILEMELFRGIGSVRVHTYRCKKCEGKKVVEREQTLDVLVERGMTDRDEIRFKGFANEAVCLLQLQLPLSYNLLLFGELFSHLPPGEGPARTTVKNDLIFLTPSKSHKIRLEKPKKNCIEPI